MSNESHPHSNSHPPAHDADSGCANDPTPPATAPPSAAQDSDIGVKLDVLPNIDISADLGGVAPGNELGASISADISSDTGDSSSSGIDIDVALAAPDLEGGTPLDIGGLLGGGEAESGYPFVSLDSETDAVVNVPVFGEHGLLADSTELGGVVNGSHDVGSLLTAAMLDIGGDGGLGAILSTDAYDGNVPLASDLSSALDSTLDLLTTTSSLFDVPALDILSCDGLDG